jgi:hypothetical protein
VAKVKRKHTRRLVAPPPAELDLSLTTSPVWMPLREAVVRAGTFEALLPALSDGRIRARAADFYSGPNGGAVKRPDHGIYPPWWAGARIDPASDRGYFAMEFFDMLAVGIEVERAAVEALWPAKPESPRPASVTSPPARKKSKGKKAAVGAKESVVWVELVAYLKDKFPGKPCPQSDVSFNAAKNWLLDNNKALLAESTIRAGLKRHFPKWPRNSNRR